MHITLVPMGIISTIPLREASLSKSSKARPPWDMIDVIVSSYHIKWYVVTCWNKYYTQYVHNIKVMQTNKWVDKAVVWYFIGPTSSISVIKWHVIQQYHVMYRAWLFIWGYIGSTVTMLSPLTSHNATKRS